MLISEIHCGCGGSVEARYGRVLASGRKRDWIVICTSCSLHTSYWFTKRQAVESFIIATRFHLVKIR